MAYYITQPDFLHFPLKKEFQALFNTNRANEILMIVFLLLRIQDTTPYIKNKNKMIISYVSLLMFREVNNEVTLWEINAQ